jgi:predicted dinucleotide-binding enzyme
MLIGLIGAGRIGATLARLSIDHGFDVVIANSRGPETLAPLVAELGPRASAAAVHDVARAGDLVVVTIPLKAYVEVPAAPLVGKVVIDTANYYPDRDGRFSALDSAATTSSEILARHLDGARVVKAFNTIFFEHLGSQGEPAGTAGRRALPIAGDDATAKSTVSAYIDTLGFDVVDAGPLGEGRRFQPGTPAYNVRLDATALREALSLT